ncbi:hypothetical protein PIB30_050445 [Stylosanthes scabra]|uniref:Uncharacterized protein n=1 Tax=Stylosanthes scabra TaxID=79078 RepID=A0ABU6SIL5_9FABA|nr:hypothetical protein [Stylosanthes scabra]
MGLCCARMDGQIVVQHCISHETADLGGCVSLIMSWIYHKFHAWGPSHLDVPTFPLARKLSGMAQPSRDHQARRLLAWHIRLGQCHVEDFRVEDVSALVFPCADFVLQPSPHGAW